MINLREPTSFHEDEAPSEIQMRVSSRHLCLASPYFEKMLSGTWKESTSNQEGLYKISVSDWNVEALLIVFNIIHGHNRNVPRSIGLEMLAEVAAIVDYFDCREAVDPFHDIWIQSLKGQIPKSYGKDSTLWLSISWVFFRMDVMNKMAQLTLMNCTKTPQTMDLPFPPTLITKIEEQRQMIIRRMCRMLNELLKKLCDRVSCKQECSAMLLGSLLRQMHAKGLASLQYEWPFHGYSIESLMAILSEFSSTALSSWGYDSNGRRSTNKCSCTLQSMIKDELGVLRSSLDTLELIKIEVK
ncbi:hypothetical protein B0I35DRAFT_360905 [Stachybotrys elegans]|uniref:BTB domain-containing protein n=1 Tax=Stachybotrys elegans TaxID=80388 RepID=A0A8K0SHR8_9HYPO|nr:hypothetical protein B0I35DRAFT_360905 [Stachybotrys elegans]